ncbi:reverse transcriptase domain-containing protein [Tanacetum coccineum]
MVRKPESYIVPQDNILYYTMGFLILGLMWALVILLKNDMRVNRMLGTGLVALYLVLLSVRLPGRRSPGSSLFTSGFISEVGVGSVYISPLPYLAAGLGMLLLLLLSVRIPDATGILPLAGLTNAFQLIEAVSITCLDIVVGNDGVLELKNFILSFDLITHEFKELNLPISIANQFASDISISKLNESLVVSAYTNEVDAVYGVWMMGEEGGAMTSFTKIFNIKTPDYLSISKVLGFTMSGEPIMETKNVYKEYPTVEIYKLCSEQINNLGIEGKHGPFFVSPYAETLLLVDHSDSCIISNDY